MPNSIHRPCRLTHDFINWRRKEPYGKKSYDLKWQGVHKTFLHYHFHETEKISRTSQNDLKLAETSRNDPKPTETTQKIAKRPETIQNFEIGEIWNFLLAFAFQISSPNAKI